MTSMNCDNHIFFIALIVKCGSKKDSFNFHFHPHSKETIWNGWLGISSTDINEYSLILCHILKSNTNLKSIVTNTTKALVVINSSDSYHVNFEIFGIKEANITVIILKYTDGLKLSAILQNPSSQLFARIKIDERSLIYQALPDFYQVTPDELLNASPSKFLFKITVLH